MVKNSRGKNGLRASAQQLWAAQWICHWASKVPSRKSCWAVLAEHEWGSFIGTDDLGDKMLQWAFLDTNSEQKSSAFLRVLAKLLLPCPHWSSFSPKLLTPGPSALAWAVLSHFPLFSVLPALLSSMKTDSRSGPYGSVYSSPLPAHFEDLLEDWNIVKGLAKRGHSLTQSPVAPIVFS